MKILIYGLNYAPELTGIGKYTGELAEWLAARKHEVRVVTAPPYYPTWEVQQGYSASRYQTEWTGNIKIYRCPIWVPHSPKALTRIFHLISFAISSLIVVLWQSIFWRPNLVLLIVPTLFCAGGAWLAARLSGAHAWLHIQDFELETASSLGMLGNGLLPKIAFGLEEWFLHRFDRVSAISGHMLEHLRSKWKEDPSKLVLFPNWVDTDFIFPLKDSSPMREKLGITSDKVVALYSGNMGEKQGLELVIEAARTLEDRKNLLFILCGGGAVRDHLFKMAEGLTNVLFLPLQFSNELNNLLNLADIHLLPQRADVEDLVMPSKLTGILASGRPVIATVRPGTQIAEVVATCGITVPPGDVQALANTLVYLESYPEERLRLGVAARNFAVENFSQKKILGEVEAKMDSYYYRCGEVEKNAKKVVS